MTLDLQWRGSQGSVPLARLSEAHGISGTSLPGGGRGNQNRSQARRQNDREVVLFRLDAQRDDRVNPSDCAGVTDENFVDAI
jgi:hypothetical protein